MTMPVQPEWLRADVMGAPERVDRDKKVIRGYVIAKEGPFKTKGRGEFDRAAIQKIVDLGNGQPKGLKSRLGHPTLSDDGVGKFLGRARDLRMSEEAGLAVARGDLYLSPDSFKTPHGDLGSYVLNRAEADPDSLSSSIVVSPQKIKRLDANGKPAVDALGEPLPPMWVPMLLHASDIVDTGEAVDGLLSVDGLPDAEVRRGTELLDAAFDGQPPEVIRARAVAWLEKYLAVRFPVDEDEKAALAMRMELRKRMLQSRERSL